VKEKLLLLFLFYFFDTELLNLPWYYSNKHITSTNLGIVVTLAASTLIKLFVEMLNPFFFSPPKKQNFVKENIQSYWNIL